MKTNIDYNHENHRDLIKVSDKRKLHTWKLLIQIKGSPLPIERMITVTHDNLAKLLDENNFISVNAEFELINERLKHQIPDIKGMNMIDDYDIIDISMIDKELRK